MDHFCRPLLDFISSYTTLDAGLKEDIKSQSKYVIVQKGERIFNKGETAKCVWFILSGRAISYFTDRNGKTITWMFHFNEPYSGTKNLFLGDYNSFINITPGTMSIKAITKIVLIQINFSTFEMACKFHPAFEKFLRVLNEKAFTFSYERLHMQLTMQASEKYLKMQREEPYLLNLFSNYHLASYLGLAPQTMSRIRSKLHITTVF